jgi:hypothetical protein
VRRLVDDRNFAVSPQLELAGRPHSTVVWTKRDGDHILFALPKNPRVTVVVFDTADPYRSVQVQGTADVADDLDGVLVEELSQKYTGGPYPGFAGPDPHWVTARISADKVTTSSPDA